MPRELAYILKIFNRLRRRKGSNGFGVGPIEWPDIDAFVRNTRVDLKPWEIEVIESLDDLFLLERNKAGETEDADV